MHSLSPKNDDGIFRSPRFSRSRAPTITINNSQPHDYCPEIIGWPAPPPNPILRNDHLHKHLNLNATHVGHSSSFSPLTIPNYITTAVQTSPYSSPHHSPRPGGMNTLEFDGSSTRFLSSVLKAVTASASPNTGMGVLESELRQKIQSLEELVAEYERQKFNVMGTFSDYRERVAERERRLEADYSNKIIGLSEEVLEAKKDFEARMKTFQTLQEQFEREKEQALEKLRQEHQKEIETLEKRFSDSQLLNLEQKYMLEIRRLEEERKSLKSEKERLGESFEIKLRRAQGLYESELTAAKLLYSRELHALKDHEEALKAELVARQEEFYDRLSELQRQSKQSRDEMDNCKNEVAQLEQKLAAKRLEIEAITKELEAVRKEATESLKKLEEANADAEGSRNKFARQKIELDKKIGQLKAAELTRDRLEVTIRELRSEVKALKNRVELLEMERDNFQSQSESQSQLHDSQVKALEAMLESVTKEKEATTKHYEKLVERNRELAEEREYAIKREFSIKLNELESQYSALREHIDKTDDDCGTGNMKLWEEIENLRSAKKILEDEISTLRNQLEDAQSKIPSLGTIERFDSTITRVLHKLDPKDNNQIVAVDSSTETHSKTRVELPELLQKLKNLEKSLEEIIVEKNEAQEKVAQLGEENRLLCEEFDRFKKGKANSREENEKLESERVLSKYKERIDELEKMLQDLQQSSNFQQEIYNEKRIFERRESEESSYEEVDLLRERLTEAEEKSKKLADELHKTQKRLKTLETQQDNSDLGEAIFKLEEKHKEEIQRLRNQEQNLTSQIGNLRGELKQLAVQKAIEKREDETQTDALELANAGLKKETPLKSRFQCLTPRKESRSQSMATSEDIAMCQKVTATSRYQNLVSEIDKRQRERSNRSIPGRSDDRLADDIAARRSPSQKDSMSSEAHSWATTIVPTSSRSRTSLLDRRDRGSFKLKFDSSSEGNSDSPLQDRSPISPIHRSTRSMLSPSAMEIASPRRSLRASPGRQLLYKAPYDNKRPAWKF